MSVERQREFTANYPEEAQRLQAIVAGAKPEGSIESSNPITKLNVLDRLTQERDESYHKFALRFKDLDAEAKLKVLANPEFKPVVDRYPDLFTMDHDVALSSPSPMATQGAVSDVSRAQPGIGDEAFKRNLRRGLKR